MSQTAKIEIVDEGPVRTLWLNRPEKRNALDSEMLEGLLSALNAPSTDAARVCVLRARGSVFCAGLDLRDLQTSRDNATRFEQVLETIELHPLPFVAVVQGDAIAGGNELALHCDLVVASTTARFGMSLAQLGLVPSWFLAKKLMEVAGPVATREILLLGDPLPAQRVHELGIIARIAPPDDLQAAAASVIDRLAANAPLSLRAMKQLLVRQMRFRDDIDHADVNELIRQARSSEDAREGVRARLDKRTPDFKGR